MPSATTNPRTGKNYSCHKTVLNSVPLDCACREKAFTTVIASGAIVLSNILEQEPSGHTDVSLCARRRVQKVDAAISPKLSARTLSFVRSVDEPFHDLSTRETPERWPKILPAGCVLQAAGLPKPRSKIHMYFSACSPLPSLLFYTAIKPLTEREEEDGRDLHGACGVSG